MIFCKLYLTPFFKKIGFEQVIFNHGNKEFGKDFILVTKNLFGKKEYYGVQAKAGSLSGTAASNITEITNQILEVMRDRNYRDKIFPAVIYSEERIIILSS